ncbi:MAG: hypothetical protein ABSG87_05975 [Verrucomicrobiota bacterium]
MKSHLEIHDDYALPKGDCHPSCLVIFSRSGKKPVAKVPLSELEFVNLLAAQKRPEFHGMKPEHIIPAAIREKLTKHNIPLTELEFAKTEANGLLQLLSDTIDYQSRNGCSFSGPEIEHICTGVALFVRSTQARLNKAFDETFHTIYRKVEVAS